MLSLSPHPSILVLAHEMHEQTTNSLKPSCLYNSRYQITFQPASLISRERKACQFCNEVCKGNALCFHSVLSMKLFNGTKKQIFGIDLLDNLDSSSIAVSEMLLLPEQCFVLAHRDLVGLYIFSSLLSSNFSLTASAQLFLCCDCWKGSSVWGCLQKL